jgi:hypothetical protein
MSTAKAPAGISGVVGEDCLRLSRRWWIGLSPCSRVSACRGGNHNRTSPLLRRTRHAVHASARRVRLFTWSHGPFVGTRPGS